LTKGRIATFSRRFVAGRWRFLCDQCDHSILIGECRSGRFHTICRCVCRECQAMQVDGNEVYADAGGPGIFRSSPASGDPVDSLAAAQALQTLCPERVLENSALDEAWNRCHCQRGHGRCLRTARPRQRHCGPCTPLCRCQCPACAYDPGATFLGETETELVHATTKQQAEAQILKTDRRCDLP